MMPDHYNEYPIMNITKVIFGKGCNLKDLSGKLIKVTGLAFFNVSVICFKDNVSYFPIFIEKSGIYFEADH